MLRYQGVGCDAEGEARRNHEDGSLRGLSSHSRHGRRLRASRGELQALFDMIAGVSGSFPNYRYRGCEVDVESDLSSITFHMHGGQRKHDREACFALMDSLAKRLGWTLLNPMADL